ncbi:MAG: 16S rRNA (cytosine(1402)-N(4))-methyltransferase RsmH [Chitinophagales bacterium]|nr:16S rRNA (cytosine(1402)-N(4))-methyltransferase RsmH [Chitinophagales bacterium]MDW8274419.1 16S rRNA (cytosine(1402)-N(4))-methyltransferase RsmH [Chitinophagales bacterium]
MSWKKENEKHEVWHTSDAVHHVPVLLHEGVSGLITHPDGVYVDATFGGGGHAREILKRLSDKGRLIAFDQDAQAMKYVPEDKRLTFFNANFRYMQRFLRAEGITKVHGILADLGVSSYQLDAAERGFSYRYNAPLDMRMNTAGKLTAADVLNESSEEKLVSIFSRYGEVRNSKKLAAEIVKARQSRQWRFTGELVQLCRSLSKGNPQRYLSQVFQAIRMEVNDEASALETFLKQSAEVLNTGGRLAIITFHSIEDRMVKNFMKSGNIEGEHQKDEFGKILKPFRLITKKPIVPRKEELKANPRARSAKLRIAEKT